MYCMFYIVYVYLYMYKVLLILFIYLLYFDDQINAELVSIRNFHNHKKNTYRLQTFDWYLICNLKLCILIVFILK